MMTTNDRIQAGLQQAKDEVSELKSDAERKVAKAVAKGFIETERAKDESVFSGVSADAKSQHEKLQAQQAQLKSAISTKSGEARTKLQADLDRVSAQIAASEAAMDEYYARRDEGVIGLN
jgi:ribosomal protein S20